MSPRKTKQRKCREPDCDEPLYLGGFCKEHHEEDLKRAELRDAAVDLLHKGIVDKSEVTGDEVRAELLELRPRWWRVCEVLQSDRGKPDMPLDEAFYAQEWCVTLAQQLVEAERAIRSGQKQLPHRYPHDQLWVRLHNLEAGLMSNGLPRHG